MRIVAVYHLECDARAVRLARVNKVFRHCWKVAEGVFDQRWDAQLTLPQKRVRAEQKRLNTEHIMIEFYKHTGYGAACVERGVENSIPINTHAQAILHCRLSTDR